MKTNLENTFNQLKVLILSGIVILITQRINVGSKMNLNGAIFGMLMIIIVSILALKIKELIPLDIPAFAWASLIGLLLSTPISPLAKPFLEFTSNISTGVIGTVILAVAGISIGTRLEDVKKLSWKIVIIAFVVFLGTFFGSALISQLILKTQGII